MLGIEGVSFYLYLYLSPEFCCAWGVQARADHHLPLKYTTTDLLSDTRRQKDLPRQ